MKLSTQEEYGLRCLLQIGRKARVDGEGLTIAEISQAEGLSTANVAKVMRTLRMGGIVESSRGQSGGYSLARPAEEINVGEVVAVLGGRFFGPNFCEDHSGIEDLCTHTVDCSVRSLWSTVQAVVDQMLGRISLKDMMGEENAMRSRAEGIADEILQVAPS
jgi:Rrf2 family protein